MSVSGFTPAPSTSSATGSSPATSSSHQLSKVGPPKKQLRALEGTQSSEDSPQVLGDTTDEELLQGVVQAVPNVPEHGANATTHLDNDAFHDADDFVPQADRNSTLEGSGNLTKRVANEVVEIDSETKQEVKDEEKEKHAEAVFGDCPDPPCRKQSGGRRTVKGNLHRALF